jgi:phage/plasmid-like protein (TIGR03299 family)
MAHELEILTNGNASMFYVGEAPWHRLGTKLNNSPSIREAIVAAGLDWAVKMRPLFTDRGEAVPAKATYRETDNRILGVVGPEYKVLQNTEAFDFFEPLVDSKLVSLETAGSLRDGRKVWVLARVNNVQSDIVSGDCVEAYVLLSNSHDGTIAVRVGFTPVRVVCNNTLSMAIDNASSKLIRLKHRGDVVGSLERVREIMNLATQNFEATVEQYKALASRQINQADLEKYIKIVFQTKATEHSENAGDRVYNKISPLFEGGRGNGQVGVKGTMWAAYNAITEYLQHERGRDELVRLDSAWFGQSASLNKKALEVAVDMIKDAA